MSLSYIYTVKKKGVRVRVSDNALAGFDLFQRSRQKALFKKNFNLKLIKNELKIKIKLLKNMNYSIDTDKINISIEYFILFSVVSDNAMRMGVGV
jgi:hypothetical protein